MYLSYLLAAYCAQEVEERGKAAAGYLLFGLLTPSFFALFWQKEGKQEGNVLLEPAAQMFLLLIFGNVHLKLLYYW